MVNHIINNGCGEPEACNISRKYSKNILLSSRFRQLQWGWGGDLNKQRESVSVMRNPLKHGWRVDQIWKEKTFKIKKGG